MVLQRYLLALGSNRRHGRFGAPERVLAAAVGALAAGGLEVRQLSPIIRSAPLGPSRRRYANAAVTVQTRLEPEALLAALKATEREFGRVRGGQRWAARVLDLDIVLWSGGVWATPGLIIPHPAFRQRAFVLGPARAIAPAWRDPIGGLTLRQLHARLTRPRAVRKRPLWSGP